MSEEASEGKANISLSQTNPEVLTAEPRRGGYVSVPQEDDISPSESTSKLSKIGSTGSKCGCQKVVNAAEQDDSGLPIPSYLLLKKLSQSRVPADPCTDTECSMEDSLLDSKTQSIKMLSITIGCVMLLASQADVSLENLTIAEYYLDCMRDENGDYPPNIEGILKKICQLKSSKSPPEDAPPTVMEMPTCEKRVEFKKMKCGKNKKIVPKISKAQKYFHEK